MAAPRREHDPFQREETDLSSARFNPLTALYSSNVSIPYPDVRLYNNLAEYESVMKRSGSGRRTSGPSSESDIHGNVTATGSSVQTFDYGHGSGDATATFDYGHGSSVASGNIPPLLPDRSDIQHPRGTVDRYLQPSGDYRRESHRDFGSRDSVRPRTDPRSAPLYTEADLNREHSVHHPTRAHLHQDPYNYKQFPDPVRHSHPSANTRDPEYLERRGLHERDYELYKISKREPPPPPRNLQIQTKANSGTKGADPKFTKVSASVGGAKGAWSYDKVEKHVVKTLSTETQMKLDGSRLPESFEIIQDDTNIASYMDESRNVFTRMEEYAAASSGPLHILYRCMKEKLQARVWTRSAVCVRGICKGYIVAFDKHSNLAMRDVDEYYRNPAMKGVRLKSKKKLAEKMQAGHIEPPLPCEATWLGLRKEKLCQRHLNQVFIRGDNVVSISIVQDWT